MSDRQLLILYMATERDESGNPKAVMDAPSPPSPKKLYRRFLFLNGIHDPDQVEKLWAERQKTHQVPRSGRG